MSEPNIFSSDLNLALQYIKGEYCYRLNAADSFDPELPMMKNKAFGGTLAMWRRDLDPYISVHPSLSPSVLPIILKYPGTQVSAHITIYLPTSGQDDNFLSELSNLRICIEDICEKYPDILVFVRGDSNCNTNNINRTSLFHQFISDFSLTRLDIPHKTYHHFTGQGAYDSDIDVILSPKKLDRPEELVRTVCQLEDPSINSHHDVIFSTFVLPAASPTSAPGLITAPKLSIPRFKTLWSEEGITYYADLLGPHLKRIRDNWLSPSSQACTSILLSATNDVMVSAASHTNHNVNLSEKKSSKSVRIPRAVKLSKQRLRSAVNSLKSYYKPGVSTDTLNCARDSLSAAKTNYRKAVRKVRFQNDRQRDKNLNNILSHDPSAAYKYIRRGRQSDVVSIQTLYVDKKRYYGEQVADGFYDSMSNLKKCNFESYENDQCFGNFLEDYKYILKLCKNESQQKIPSISFECSCRLINRIKKQVNDIFSITAAHYLNAGEEGLLHYNFLLNCIISDLNNSTMEELNTIYAIILYKSHGRDKYCDRSYRSISTCPFLSKSIDLYLRDLYGGEWDKQQAATQYQGAGQSHELASLLVTEAVQHSLHVKNTPIYLLCLDAQSAFDRVVRQILVRQLYLSGVKGDALLFIDNKLKNRSTVYEWDKVMMGPVQDDLGLEQGAICSSDFYKLYNNDQLKDAQSSGLGVDMGSSVVGAVGQADDIVLVGNDIHSLQYLVRLTEDYCHSHKVVLVPSKTKLLKMFKKSHQQMINYCQAINPIMIAGSNIDFVDQAEHVGVLRSTNGNLPNIAARITAHKRAMGSVLSAGLAIRHRSNPQSALRVMKLYGDPVLFSGLSSLVLSKSEIKMLDNHHKNTLRNMLKMFKGTPRSFICLVGGSLPGEAILHLKQLTLFGMIARLPDDPLHHHAIYILSQQLRNGKSWFLIIDKLTNQYNLPNPLSLLHSPMAKNEFKVLCKKKVLEYWQEILRAEARALPSLQFFKPEFYTLSRPAQSLVSAGNSGYEVSKLIVQLRLLSGRYRTERLCRFWSDNREGVCLFNTCLGQSDTVDHIISVCPALQHVRVRMQNMWLTRTESYPALQSLIRSLLCLPSLQRTQFILDPSTNPDVIRLVQEYGRDVLDQILYLTRTYAFSIHRERKIFLGQWFGSGYPAPDRVPSSITINMSNVYVCEGNGPASYESPATTRLLPDEPDLTTTADPSQTPDTGWQSIANLPPPIPPERPQTASVQPVPTAQPLSVPDTGVKHDTVIQLELNTVIPSTVLNNMCPQTPDFLISLFERSTRVPRDDEHLHFPSCHTKCTFIDPRKSAW